jgi:hypothetical protein
MRFFNTLHFLSLDVVLSVISMHMMFYHFFMRHWPSWEISALLGISVYLIYGIDRQIDNRTSASRDALHAFHARYASPLILVMIGLFLLNLYLLTLVDNALILSGLGMVIVLLGYWFAWVQRVLDRIWGLKEALTASIFSVGIFLPTAARFGFSSELITMGLVVFLLALQNLWLFTLLADGGKWHFWIVLMWVILGILPVLGLLGANLFILSVMFIIWGIHVWIYYFRAQMQMRYLGDLAFASPLIYILCHY